MKADIHPDYRPVVFQDTSSGDTFLTRSTIETSETIEWEDGNNYPLAKVEISSASHPFFTGTMKIVDTAGRVERFERRYGKRRKKQAPARRVRQLTPPLGTMDAERRCGARDWRSCAPWRRSADAQGESLAFGPVVRGRAAGLDHGRRPRHPGRGRGLGAPRRGRGAARGGRAVRHG